MRKVVLIILLLSILIPGCKHPEELKSWEYEVLPEDTEYIDPYYFTTIEDSRFKKNEFYDVWIKRENYSVRLLTFSEIAVYDGKMEILTINDLIGETLIIYYYD